MPAAGRNLRRLLCSGESTGDRCFCPALAMASCPCPSEPCTSLTSHRCTLLQGLSHRWPAADCIRLAGHVSTAAPGSPGPSVTRGLEPDDAVQPDSERHPGGRRRQVGGRALWAGRWAVRCCGSTGNTGSCADFLWSFATMPPYNAFYDPHRSEPLWPPLVACTAGASRRRLRSWQRCRSVRCGTCWPSSSWSLAVALRPWWRRWVLACLLLW
jgi:hypothetical protein